MRVWLRPGTRDGQRQAAGPIINTAINAGITAAIGVAIVMMAGGTVLSAQTPQPFPMPRSSTPQPAPPAPPPTAPAAPAEAPATQPAVPAGAPDLGVPLYPSAVYLTSYDAGRGQRFYLFGVSLSYAEAVQYYRTVLKQRGDQLFESPPTHQFETARFNDNTMAFPPSITVKDFTWGGSAGYLNPHAGSQPERFPTIIQVVPPPGVPR